MFELGVCVLINRDTSRFFANYYNPQRLVQAHSMNIRIDLRHAYHYDHYFCVCMKRSFFFSLNKSQLETDTHTASYIICIKL